MATSSVSRSRQKQLAKPRPSRKCEFKGCKVSHAFWWNAAKDGWYLTVRDPSRPNGQRQDRLTKGWDSHDDAALIWHEFESSRAKETPVERLGEGTKVVDLCNLFLENLELKISSKRFRITKDYLTDLCTSIGDETVGELRQGGIARIEKWMAMHTGWVSPSTKRSVVSRVKQVFKWGADQGYIVSSPIKALKRESDEIRVAIFSQKQVDAILKHSDPAFATVFKVLLQTGCRPNELCQMTAADVEEDGGLHLQVNHKNQKTKTYRGSKRRIYLLFKDLKETVRKAVESNPDGPLFRTSTGKAWKIATICKVFRDVAATPACKKLGLNDGTDLKRTDGTKVRKHKFVPYVCRHTFAFRLLSGFYRDADGKRIKKNYGEVGVYLGDSARMVEDVYGKLVKATEMLAEEIG